MEFHDFVVGGLIEANLKLGCFRHGNELIKRRRDIFDLELKDSVELGKFFVDHYLAYPECFKVVVENLGEFQDQDGKGDLIVYVDPLDNSQGYFSRQGTIGFPFSSCICVMPRDGRYFKDILAGGVIDHRSRDLFYGERSGDRYISLLNEQEIQASDEGFNMHASGVTILTDLYYRDNRDFLSEIFPEEKRILGSMGSNSLEMVYTTLENVALYFSYRQKMHELGAAYVINKGAGREINHIEDGDDLAEYIYDFNSWLPVVIAANRKIRQEFFTRIAV